MIVVGYYYTENYICSILVKINVYIFAAVAANGHGCQTLVKMVNRLHSNLCSLADCIKQLWRLFTHNTNSQARAWLYFCLRVTFQNPTVLFIFGMRLFKSGLSQQQSRLVCLCVIWDKHNLNFHGCASSTTIPKSTSVRRVWDCIVDLLAEKEVTISLNTSVSSTFGMENVFRSEIWRRTAVYWCVL